ncbi:serine protein kinase [Colletotrichum tofieldiae]|nr:serine protein kinase [Colletotrichum tofieldiae]GKT74793.1 serine protein kinase [Colletotrichum tofieldiae]GKT91989.1 serine protein kinase [Colletotrichum tofieldiae]
MHFSWLLLSLTSYVPTAQRVLAEAASQKPLGASPDSETLRSAQPAPVSDDPTASSWHAARLNYSSPAPHLFASTYGLLQQWSNTMFPNGHTMAAVEIPAFTLLYHGRMDEEGAPSPEWLAFDM